MIILLNVYIDYAQGAATQWPVNDRPWRLSVNAVHNLLVTCRVASKIKEYTTDGHIVRTVCLPGDVIHPWHTVQLRSGQFIVCHGYPGDAVHRVCMISADGRDIVRVRIGPERTGTAFRLFFLNRNGVPVHFF